MHGMGVASHGRDLGWNRGPNAMKRLHLSPGDKGLSFREVLVFSACFFRQFSASEMLARGLFGGSRIAAVPSRK